MTKREWSGKQLRPRENLKRKDWIFDHAAFVVAYTGHLQEARSMSQRAVDFAQEAGHREKAALFETRVTLREAFFGNAHAAKQGATEALALAKDREVQFGAAFALALSGDSSRAQTLANDLERNFPEDTAVRFNYMPSLRAVLALNHGEPVKATELLQTAVPNELGQSRSSNGYFGALYPIYVRGQAYLASHQGAQAAGEFRKILDHRGAVIVDPISVLAHLQLGRAYALSGDETKAKIAYQDFLTLWKDADRDIPVLKQAKAIYKQAMDRKLNSGLLHEQRFMIAYLEDDTAEMDRQVAALSGKAEQAYLIRDTGMFAAQQGRINTWQWSGFTPI